MTRSNRPPRISRESSSPLASSGVAIRTSALVAGRRGVECVEQVAVAGGDRQDLRLAGVADNGEGVVVDLQGVLHREPDFELGQPAVGDIELERLVALGRKLKCDRVNQLALAAGLVGGMAKELGFSVHPLGTEVVDPAEELVDVGLLVIEPGLKGDDGHVVGRDREPWPWRPSGSTRRHGRRRVGAGRRADHHELRLEVPQAEALDVGEAAVGVDEHFGRDERGRGHHPLADLLGRIGQPGGHLQRLAERRGRLGGRDGIDPLQQGGLSPV